MNTKHSHTIRSALAVLLAALLASLSVGTARADVNLYVRVVDCKTGLPISGANVNVPTANLSVQSASQAITDGQGVANVNPLRTEGKHRIEISAPGYRSKAVIANFPAWTKQEVRVCLEPTGPVGSQGQKNSGSEKTVGNSEDSTGMAGDPVSTSIGEYFFRQPLLDLGGPLPVQFTLNYAASMDKSPAFYNDPFGGDNFSHNFHIALKRVDDATAVAFFGDGNLVKFRKADGRWQIAEEEVIYQLQESDKRYYLLDPIAEIAYTFDKSGALDVLVRVEDRNGNALTFTNDVAGRVTRIDDGLGRSLTFTYANPTDKWTWPHLVQVTDAYNRAIKFTYQTTSEPVLTTHLTSVTDVLGATTAFTYAGTVTNTVVASVTYPRGNTEYTQKYSVVSDLWAVNSQTDAMGNTTKIEFDGKGATTITDPLGNSSQHGYKDGLRLSSLKDAAGKTASLEYDASGRRTSITDRMGDTTKFAYHAPTGKLASVTNARGDTISFTYAPQEQAIGPDKIPFTFYNLARVDYPDKASEQFTYDAAGNALTSVDRAGQPWKYTYNNRGQTLTVTNSTGGVTTFTYNADATLASRKDADTGATTYGYDALKRLNKITRADNPALSGVEGSTIQIAYDANDRVIAYTDANNRTTKSEYDPNGNLIKVTDAAGNSLVYSYDAMDRVTKITDRLGKSSAFEYDKLGRVASVTDAAGVTTQYGYDARGWLNQVTRAGEAWKIGYDDEGVATSFTTPSGNVTQTQRDKLGLLVGATNALNQNATLTRDSLSRVTGVTDALNRATNYAYDPRGLLAGVTMPVVGASKYERDAMGNLTRIADLNGAEWKFAYTAMGRLKSTTDPVGQTGSLSYDPRGRLSQVVYPDGVTRTFTYDAASNLTRSRYSDGTDAQYTFDALNRLIETNGVKLTRDAEGRITSTDDPAGRLYGATYTDAGGLRTVTYANGAFTVTYTYDNKTGLLTQVSDSLTKTQIDFTYDKDRRLVGIARSNKVNTTLTWDKAGRLTGIRDAKTSEVSQTSEVLNLQYTLDAAGQVTGAKMTAPLDPASALVGATTQGATRQGSPLQYDAASQISSAGYKYDARGRLVVSPNQTYKWNGASKLVGIGDTTLGYNGLGDLESRQDAAASVRYLYNYALGLNPIVAEMDAATGDFLRYYVWSPGGELLYMIDAADGNKPYFYHFDRTGSTLALTDANGAITDAYAYDPYGQVLAHEGDSAQPFTFVGRWGVRQEGSSGALYHMRARYYEATTARFISREPIWPLLSDPRQINPYQYALENPVSHLDPLGTGVWSWIMALLGLGSETPGVPTNVASLTVALLKGTPTGFQGQGVDPEWGPKGAPWDVKVRTYVAYDIGNLPNPQPWELRYIAEVQQREEEYQAERRFQEWLRKFIERRERRKERERKEELEFLREKDRNEADVNRFVGNRETPNKLEQLLEYPRPRFAGMGGPPPPRRFHYMTAAADVFRIFGGESETVPEFNDSWEFSFTTQSWTQVSQQGTEQPGP